MINSKILLIDDNAKNLQVAMGILSKEGYNLVYAQDGEKGLELAKSGDIDLILLDVIMPKLDGYEVCKKLKSNPQTSEIPVIFLTIKDEEQDIITGFEQGGIDYVTKPFYTEVLLKRVKTHLNLAKTTKELKHLNENLEQQVKKQVQNLRLKDQVLFQQAKMASMGEMIANIAHQWRQPLGAISATTLGLKTKFALDKFELDNERGVKKCKEQVNEKLDDIETYVNTLSNTINDFRNFFKPQKDLDVFESASVIESSLKLLSYSLHNGDITIVKDINSVKITGFESELSQAVINILNNAKDVLNGQKDLKKFIFISTKQIGDEAYIVIKDSGGGIKSENKEDIFKPYFTTKSENDGTGIGLWMSREIVENHMNGKIEVKNITYTYENEELKGAKFTIKIPISIKK